MTPKQREVLSDLQTKICSLDSYIGRLKRELLNLTDYFDSTTAPDKGEFTSDKIDGLLSFNQRLTELERYLFELGTKESDHLDARVSDPNDPLDDYEIEATHYFTLGKDDSAFDGDDDNCLTQRQISLKRLNRDYGLGDGLDHREPFRQFPGALNEVPHCWLFYDLYDYNYGLEQSSLTLQDCLRVDLIWVDVAIHQQATLDIKTGNWLQPIELRILG